MSSPDESSQPKEAVTQPERKPRRWRRRLRTAAITVAALAVGARLALPFALPGLLERTLADYGLEGRYDDLDLSLLGGRLELWHLELAPERGEDAQPAAAPAPDALAWLEYAVFDLQVSALLRGELVARRVEVDGLDVWLARDTAGVWNIERLAQSDAEPDEQQPDEPDTSEEQAPEEQAPAPDDELDLGLPLRLDAVRLQQVALHLDDRYMVDTPDNTAENSAADAPLAARFDLDVSASDLGSEERPAHAVIELQSPDLLDRLRIEARGSSGGAAASLQLELWLDGLDLRPLERYLGSAGVRQETDDIGGRLSAQFELGPHPTRARDLAGGLSIGPVRLGPTLGTQAGAGEDGSAHDGIALERLAIEIGSLLGPTLELASLELDGLAAAATGRPDGRLEALGLSFGPAATPAPAAEEPQDGEPDEESDASPRPLHLQRLAVGPASVTWTDASFVQPSTVALELDALTLDSLRLFDPGPNVPAALELRLHAPGIVESATLGGDIWAGAAERGLDLALDATGIAPERLAPLLAHAGLASNLDAGRLTARIGAALNDADAGVELRAGLHELTLVDGDAALFELRRLELLGATFAPGISDLGAIELAGLQLPVALDERGRTEFFGLRTLGPDEQRPARVEAQAPAPAVQAEAPTETEDPPAGRTTLERLRIEDVSLAFEDRSRSEPHRIRIGPLEVDAQDVALAPGESAGVFELSLPIEGMAAPLAMSAELSATDAGRRLDIRLDAVDFELAAAAPYLADAGWESELDGGALSAEARVDWRADGALDAELARFTVGTAGEPTAELRGLRMSGLRSEGAGTLIEKLALDGLELAARRDAEGRLHALGLVQRAPQVAAPGTKPTDPAAAAPSADAAVSAAPDKASSDAGAPTGAGAAPSSLTLGQVQLEGVRLAWLDESLAEPLSLTPELSVVASGLVVGAEPAADGAARVGLDLGPLGALTLEGAVNPSAGTHVDLTLEGSGIDLAPLAPYFPPGLVPNLTDGRLSAGLRAELGPAEAGGQRIDAAIEGLRLARGEQAEALLSLSRVGLVAPRLDPAAGHVELQRVELSGLELQVGRRPNGALELLGLVLQPADPAAADVTTETEPASTTPPAPPPAPSVALELLALETLDVELRRLRIVELGAAGATPLDVALRLANPAPLRIAALEETSGSPLALELRGRAGELIETIELDLAALRVDRETLETEARLAVGGIDGAALLAAFPSLGEGLAVDGLSDGRIEARLSSELLARRGSALLPDLGSGFGLELSLVDVGLFAGPDAERALGFDALHIEAPKLDPASGRWIANRVELERPSLHAARTARGLEFAGLTFLEPPADAADPAADVEPADPAAATDAPDPVTNTDAPAARGSDFGTQVFSVLGADIAFRDETVDPVLELPLTSLEIEARELTTRALHEPLPVSFELYAGAGAIALPERQIAKSMLTGILGAVGNAAESMVTGADKTAEIEQRPAFEELQASARLTLYPQPVGWTRLNLAAFELQALRGIASGGVEIGDGVLDLDLRTRFAADAPLRIDSRANLAYLRLSEPPGGPISSYLKLPAPLDAVIFALKNRSGELSIPLGVDVPTGGIGGGAIAGAAVNAFGRIVTNAIAGAPLRAVGTVGSLFGIGGAEEQAVEPIVVEAPFSSGGTSLGSEAELALDYAIRQLKRDDSLRALVVHEFGRGDYDRAEVFGNPSGDQVVQLVAGQRRLREELIARRGEARVEAGAALALGRLDSAEELRAEIGRIDFELANAEQSLDALGPLLAPNAARRADRRTRDTALAIAGLRLDAVSAALAAGGIDDYEQRLDVRSARATEPELPAGGRIVIVLRPGM